MHDFKKNKKIINVKRRMSPKLWDPDYFLLNSIKDELVSFINSHDIHSDKELLDIGCGDKPYKYFIPKAWKYIGIDPNNSDADLNIPFEQNKFKESQFDLILTIETMEHIPDINFAISEIRRILKDNGQVFLTIPFLYPEHGSPNDYRRLTIDGIREISKDFKLLKAKKVSGFSIAIAQITNGFLKEMFFDNILLKPIFFINNIAGLIFNKLFTNLIRLIPNTEIRHRADIFYNTYSLDTIVILQK